MPFTVKRALEQLGRYTGVNGSCDAEAILKRLNQARQLIYEAPEDFAGTTDWAVIRVSHCCNHFTLPQELEQARAAAHCQHPVPLLSKNYEFIDIGLARHCCHTDKRAPHYYHVNEARRRTPYFVDVLPERFRIRVTNDDQDDNDTELVFACRSNGRPLEVRLKLNGMAGAISTASVSDIEAVTKPLTKGNIMVWAMVGQECPQIIAEYSGRNENPRFTKYSIHGGHHHRFQQDPHHHDNQVVIFGKKKCFPYRMEDMDALVDIESMQGLIYAFQALNATEAEDDNGFVAKIKLMETNLERADHNLEVVEPMEVANVHYTTAVEFHHYGG